MKQEAQPHTERDVKQRKQPQTSRRSVMKKSYLFIVLLVFGLSITATQAIAAGTLAGILGGISNQATVYYNVGTIPQTPVDSGFDTDGDGVVDSAGAPTTFEVDRKIDLTVTSLGNGNVSPGQTGAAIRYSVRNDSNDTLDFGLVAARFAGDFTSSNVNVYVDNGTLNVYDAADTATYIDELAPDAIAYVWVVADIAAGATDTQTETYALRAIAKAGGTAGTEGAVLTTAGSSNMAAVENVLADSSGDYDDNTGTNADDAYDGIHSANGQYIVSTATLTVAKSVAVYDDGVAPQEPWELFAIPGAIVTYSITVTNSGSDTASAISLVDEIPANTCFYVTAGPTGGSSYHYTSDATPVNVSTSDWTYGPNPSAVPGFIGCDTSVTAIKIKTNDILAAGSDTVSFKVKIQ